MKSKLLIFSALFLSFSNSASIFSSEVELDFDSIKQISSTPMTTFPSLESSSSSSSPKSGIESLNLFYKVLQDKKSIDEVRKFIHKHLTWVESEYKEWKERFEKFHEKTTFKDDEQKKTIYYEPLKQGYDRYNKTKKFLEDSLKQEIARRISLGEKSESTCIIL